MAENEWIPHAEREFGRFTHALGKYLPRRLTQLRRTGAQLKAMTATTPRKGKG
jgi:hypothetical protein